MNGSRTINNPVTEPAPPPPAVTAPPAEAGSADSIIHNRLTDLIVRFRWLFFIGMAVMYLVSFNGQWRIGRDSAIFRGLGTSLASGQGYEFGPFAQQHVYPGLPLLLGGLEYLFGPGALAPLLMMLAMAGATIILCYKLIRLHYPQWMAVCVAFGVGINGWFMQFAFEIMTDLPFVLGTVAALYGLERLRLGWAAPTLPSPAQPTWKTTASSILLLVAGLTLAATMRPTIWILVVAWIIFCLWGLIRGQRRYYALGLALLLGVLLTKVALDPRTEGFSPFEGGYEREAIGLIAHAGERMGRSLPRFLERHLPSAYFGQIMMPVLSSLLSLTLIGSTFLLFRRHPLWGLIVLLTFPTTLMLSTVPRYYLMIVPLLLLSWLLMLNRIIQRVPRGWGEVILLGGLAIVTLPNLARCVKVVYQQRSTPFVETYAHGYWVPIIEMSDRIREHVPPDGKVIGPEGSVSSYLSGRRVFIERDLLTGTAPWERPGLLHESGVEYAVFPHSIYAGRARYFQRLIRDGVIVPTEVLAEMDEMYLARIEIVSSADGDP